MNDSKKKYWDNFDQKLYEEYLAEKEAYRKRKALREKLIGKINLN